MLARKQKLGENEFWLGSNTRPKQVPPRCFEHAAFSMKFLIESKPSALAGSDDDLHDGPGFVFHLIDMIHNKRLVFCDSVDDSLDVHLMPSGDRPSSHDFKTGSASPSVEPELNSKHSKTTHSFSRRAVVPEVSLF